MEKMYSFSLITLLIFAISTAQTEARQLQLYSVDFATMTETQAKGSAEIRSAEVQVSESFFNQVADLQIGDQLELPMLDGQSMNMIIDRKLSYLPGYHTLILRDPANWQRHATFSWGNSGFIGKIELFDEQEFYHFRPAGEALRMAEIDRSLVDELACATHENMEVSESASKPSLKTVDVSHHHHEAAPSNVPSPSLQVPNFAQTGSEGDYVIDLLIVYTPAAQSWSNSNEGSIELTISEMMANSQLSVDNSEMPLLFRVADARLISYTADGLNSNTGSADHLRRLTASSEYNPFGNQFDGFMEEVHDWRVEVGADVVGALMEVSDVGGIAWLNTTPTPGPNRLFSVNRVQQMSFGYTFVHEVGHNMGNAHSRNQSSGIATVYGGVYDFSTGWRFEGNNGQSYATVMTYAEGSQRAPIFSNPDVLYFGTPAGSYSGFNAPADNARSMNITGPYIASLFPSVKDAPVADVSTSPIQVTLDSADGSTSQLTVTNTGDSDLFFTSEVFGVSVTPSPPTAHKNWMDRQIEPLRAGGTTLTGTEILLKTSFEQDEGFNNSANIRSVNAWANYTRNLEDRFEISNENPTDGDQHLRLNFYDNRSQGNTVYGVRSPFTGPFPNGAYRFKTDVNISETDDTSYFIRLFDSRSAASGSSGDVAMIGFNSNGTISYLSSNTPSGGWSFSGTGATWEPGEYQTLELIFSPEDNKVHAYFADEHVVSFNPIGGYKPKVVYFYRSNAGNSSHGDFDNVSLEQIYSGTEYLSISEFNSRVAPGESTILNLDFKAAGVEPGVYEAEIVMATNDPDNPEIRIPVEVTVGQDVSVPGEELPVSASLDQNYPNPFNPTTNISFSLPDAGHTQLTVYDVTGRRVATLIDGQMAQGTHRVNFDAGSLSSGVYIYRLQTGQATFTRKMMLIK